MLGAKATNALSEYFEVISKREGKVAKMSFERGKRKNFSIEQSKDNSTGTTIIFKPDIEIFKEGIELNYNILKNQIQELAYLSPGLIFHFKFKDKEIENIQSLKGIVDYIEALNKDKEKITPIFYAEKIENRVGVKISFCYNKSYTDTYKLFTNSIPNISGTHLTGFRTALTQTINEYAREHEFLKDKDNNLTGEDLKEGLVLVLSLIMPDPVFSGQTKEVLTSSEGRTIVQRLISDELITWLNSNPKEAKTIIEKALLARKARENARKAREATRNFKTQKTERVVMPGILSDCNSTDRTKCEVFIVEGMYLPILANLLADRGIL